MRKNSLNGSLQPGVEKAGSSRKSRRRWPENFRWPQVEEFGLPSGGRLHLTELLFLAQAMPDRTGGGEGVQTDKHKSADLTQTRWIKSLNIPRMGDTAHPLVGLRCF